VDPYFESLRFFFRSVRTKSAPLGEVRALFLEFLRSLQAQKGADLICTAVEARNHAAPISCVVPVRL